MFSCPVCIAVDCFCQLLFKHFHIHAVGKIHGLYFRITACQHFYIGSHTGGKAAVPGHNYTYNSKLHSLVKLSAQPRFIG